MAWDCKACGGCCSHGLLVEVAHTDTTPTKLTKLDPLIGPVMRARQGHCIALAGTPGRVTRCRIYQDRPQVCREFQQASPQCLQARLRLHLPI